MNLLLIFAPIINLINFMKKILLCAGVCFSMVASAQTDNGLLSGKPYRFGLELNPNISFLRVKTQEAKAGFTAKGSGSKAGLGFGITVAAKLKENIDFIFGARVNSMGGSVDFTDSLTLNPKTDNAFTSAELTAANGKVMYFADGSLVPATRATTIKYSSLFVEIPASIRMKTDEANGLQYWGELGASLGVRVGGKVTRTDKYSYGTTTTTYLDKYVAGSDAGSDKAGKYLFPVNFSVNVGAGVNYALSKNNAVSAGLYYQHGMLNNNFQRDEDRAKVKTKLSAIGLKVGFWF